MYERESCKGLDWIEEQIDWEPEAGNSIHYIRDYALLCIVYDHLKAVHKHPRHHHALTTEKAHEWGGNHALPGALDA